MGADDGFVHPRASYAGWPLGVYSRAVTNASQMAVRRFNAVTGLRRRLGGRLLGRVLDEGVVDVRVHLEALHRLVLGRQDGDAVGELLRYSHRLGRDHLAHEVVIED